MEYSLLINTSEMKENKTLYIMPATYMEGINASYALSVYSEYEMSLKLI